MTNCMLAPEILTEVAKLPQEMQEMHLVLADMLGPKMKEHLQSLHQLPLAERRGFASKVKEAEDAVRDCPGNPLQDMYLYVDAKMNPDGVLNIIGKRETEKRTERDRLHAKQEMLAAKHCERPPMKASTEFKIRLRGLRIAKGFTTQKALAIKIGVKEALVKSWENGSCLPNPKQRSQLNRVLNTTLPSV